jgi:hypothetical protein
MNTTTSNSDEVCFHENILKSLLVCAKRGQEGQIVERSSIKLFVEVLEGFSEELKLSPRSAELNSLKSFSGVTGILRSNEYDSFAKSSDAIVKLFLSHIEALAKSKGSYSIAAQSLLAEFPPEELNEKPCEGCEGCTNRFCEKRWE